MVTWVLESNVFAETCFDAMIAHLGAREIPHHVVRIIPFIHTIEGATPEITGPVVCYGSIGIQKLAGAQGWVPGVFAMPTEDVALEALGDLYVNHDARTMNFSDVQAYLDAEGVDEFFIKPNTDTKEFAGMVTTRAAFGDWQANLLKIGYLQTTDFEVVVSQPKKLGCEWRVVVVDGKISTASLYRQYGMVKAERHIIPEVEAVVMEAHRRFQPAPVYVIDIAQVGDDYRVVEYNTFNSAGLYECDVQCVIDDITAYVERTQ